MKMNQMDKNRSKWDKWVEKLVSEAISSRLGLEVFQSLSTYIAFNKVYSFKKPLFRFVGLCNGNQGL